MELTPRVIAYVASEEGLCKEAYKDSKGIWTWALGVTNDSGHQVFPRYKDNPQTLEKCFEVSVWLLREKYLPAILKGPPLNEAQLAAALSFHWNSGRYGKYKDDFKKAVAVRNKGLLDARRKREQDLYYKGIWPSLLCPVRSVSKKTYQPIWNKATAIDPLDFINL